MNLKKINLLLALIPLILFGCGGQSEYTEVRKQVTVVRVESYREPNSLQDYEPKWRAYMSDSTIHHCYSKPNIGDTFETVYVYRKNNIKNK